MQNQPNITLKEDARNVGFIYSYHRGARLLVNTLDIYVLVYALLSCLAASDSYYWRLAISDLGLWLL